MSTSAEAKASTPGAFSAATGAEWAAEFAKDAHSVRLQDSVAKFGLQPVAVNRQVAAAHDHAFSHKIPNEVRMHLISFILFLSAADGSSPDPVSPPLGLLLSRPFAPSALQGKATSQKSSGRCWLFAGLNSLRIPLAKEHGVQLDGFELSQAYLFFWDKFEKANYFLETLLATQDEPADGRLWSYLVDGPVNDGGQYDMFVNILEKYGAVPKAAYPDSADAGNSRSLNWLVASKLRETASFFKAYRAAQLAAGAAPEAVTAALRVRKELVLRQIFRVLCVHLGTPPQTFAWRYTAAAGKRLAVFPDALTPREFYARFVPSVASHVSFVNDPRNTYQRLYTVQHLGNVWGGRPVLYVNLPIE